LTSGFIKQAAFGVYVDAPFHDRLMRKVLRGMGQYHHKDINRIICPYLDQVEPNFQKYAAYLRSSAKYIVYNQGMVKPDDWQSSTKSILRCDEGCNLSPRLGNGSIHKGEYLTLYKKEDTHTLVYGQYDREYITEEINDQTVASLSNYYNFNCFTANG